MVVFKILAEAFATIHSLEKTAKQIAVDIPRYPLNSKVKSHNNQGNYWPDTYSVAVAEKLYQ